MKGLCNSCMRSPATVRGVTLFVLLISDIDVVFSLMFLYNLASIREEWEYATFALVYIALGMVTYLYGICQVAPRQKYKVVRAVKDMMRNSPAEFQYKKGTVTADSPIFPQGNPGQPNPKFKDLREDEVGFGQFSAGLGRYGLVHLWNGCELKNAKNECEMTHGIPLFRTASYGFMAEPTPRDLGGILNANALYSLCCGVGQVAFGVVIMFVTESVDTMVLMPLIISASSLILSILNVGLDFSLILAQIETEQRMLEQIQTECANDLTLRKQEKKAEWQKRMREVEEKFSGVGPASLVESENMKKQLTAAYEMEVDSMDQQNGDQCQAELVRYRKRVDRIRNILSGKDVVADDKRTGGEQMEAYKQEKESLMEMRQKIVEHAKEQRDKLNPSQMLADEWKKKMKEIDQDRDAKTDYIDREIELLTARHTGGSIGRQAREIPAGRGGIGASPAMYGKEEGEDPEIGLD